MDAEHSTGLCYVHSMNSRPTILGIALVLLAGFAVAPTVAKEKPAQEIFETDINSAAHGDLTELPGITDAIAERIIAERPF